MDVAFKKFCKKSPVIEKIADCVEGWHDFTFDYEGRKYTVLGVLIGLDTQKRLCLWGDVLVIDNKPQKIVESKCFYIEGLQSQVEKGCVHGRCSNDYTSIVQDALVIYLYGPMREPSLSRNKQERRLKSTATDTCSREKGLVAREKSQVARDKLEAFFGTGELFEMRKKHPKARDEVLLEALSIKRMLSQPTRRRR